MSCLVKSMIPLSRVRRGTYPVSILDLLHEYGVLLDTGDTEGLCFRADTVDKVVIL